MERAKRKPNRSGEEKIEDMFFDLEYSEQIRLLSTLQTLHRLKGRQNAKDAEAQFHKAVARTRELDTPEEQSALLDGIDLTVGRTNGDDL